MREFPDARRVDLGDITLSVHDAGSGPAVVLCHGFPELAYSWRHQLPALAEAGFHAVAPDLRGYGGSDAPDAIEAYDLPTLVADVARALEIQDQWPRIVDLCYRESRPVHRGRVPPRDVVRAFD